MGNGKSTVNSELLQLIFDTTDAAIFTVDVYGRILLVNRRMTEMFGLSVDELVGRYYISLINESDHKTALNTLKKLVNQELSIYEHERLYCRNEGAQFWGQLKARSLVNDVGRVEGVVGIITDIDAYKQIEASLKDTQVRYENTIRTIPCGLYDYVPILGGQGEFRYFSQRSEEIFELSFVELQENTALFWEMVHADDLEQLVNIDIEKNLSGELFVSEFRIILRSGKTKWVRFTSLPNEALLGAPIVWSGFILDITDQKEIEQALLEQQITLRLADERERMMEDMHDGFGSQLTSARIRAENNVLSQAEIVDLLRECMADLYLVTDTFSHHEDSLFQALINMRHRYERLSPGGQVVNIGWILQLEHLPALCSRTILQILRIIQEALTNALKHTNAKTIDISACYTDNERLTISIVDDGKGLPVDIQLGQGLLNIKKRARELGAQLELISQHPGTQVLLVLTVTCNEGGRL